MKIYELDITKLLKIGLPVISILGIFLYIFLRKIILSYLDLKAQTSGIKNVEQMRGAAKLEIKQPTIVRRTDLYEKLSEQQKAIHAEAENLVVQKRFQEAARLFISIDFQRKAIDTLEQNGFPEEAAAVLISMKVYYRAGVLLERNGHFLQAAELFLADSKQELAARCYEKLAETHYHYYKQAGELYLAAGMIDNCLTAYSKLVLSDEILRICIESAKYEFLCRYMSMPFNASAILSRLSPAQLDSIIDSTPTTPYFAQCLAMWVQYRPEGTVIASALRKTMDHVDTIQLFWSVLSAEFCQQICQLLVKDPTLLTPSIYRAHGEALSQGPKRQLGEYFLKLIPYAEPQAKSG